MYSVTLTTKVSAFNTEGTAQVSNDLVLQAVQQLRDEHPVAGRDVHLQVHAPSISYLLLNYDPSYPSYLMVVTVTAVEVQFRGGLGPVPVSE